MSLCGNDLDPFDFQSRCVREIWGSFLPAGLVIVLCFFLIPIPHTLDTLCSPFKKFLALHIAEALDGDIDKISSQDEVGGSVETVPLWRTVVFVFVGIIQFLSWIFHGSFRLYSDSMDIFGGVLPFLVAIAWLYTIIRPISLPIATSPFDLFSIYLVLFCVGSLRIGGILFDHYVFDLPWPSTITLVALSANLLALFVLLIVVLNTPLALPSKRINKKDIGYSISPENYTSLWGWITFGWVYPLIRKGRCTTLNEPDVWNLSPTMQSRPIFAKFSSVHRSTLLRRIWAANSLDLILDFSLTIASVIFNYSGPFFLKKILDAIDLQNPTPESRTKAYIYAFLAFACTLLKAQADVQHLWFGRRAATRIRSELMASIYDKALKRKDFSGVTKKDKEEVASNGSKNKTKAQKKEERDKAAKADDPKAGADVGKIVNLIASDSSRIARTASSLYFLYGAPFEILFGGVFLYQLLGLSAFAGFIVLLAMWPLNSILARRNIRIQKGLLAARDKRMGVLDELIRAVKFIKFFAWEDRWINRAMDSREAEMKLMAKIRLNSVMFYALWVIAPFFISIISFFTYVMLGNELTIGVAFTAIALFNMIRTPLNIIPNWIVQIIETQVTLKRISVYLDEEEVTDQVSSLKKDYSEPLLFGDDEGLGLECATLKWNEVVDVVEKGDQTKSSSSSTDSLVADEASTAVDAESIGEHGEHGDRIFELRNVTVRFPEGELTVVTGPTASGKTALLVAVLGEMTLVEGRIVMSKDPSRVDENGFMHSISYAAQSPWLRHQSIKDNILFGYPFDEGRYRAVIECCALQPDLDILEDGDATEIGARGVSLSGGQKARVALARAVYARTKYVLLDDPLSAVDSHTSRFLYEKLLRGPLLANRTVVLVTHHVELVLPGAYYVVRMLDGRIDKQGTVKELQAQGVLKEIERDAAVETHKKELVVAEMSSISVEESPGTTEVSKKPRKLVKDEHREIGAVKWSIYKSYLRASSYQIWLILASLVVLNQLCGITEKLWIKTWGEAYGQGDVPTLYAFRSFATIKHEVPGPMDDHLIHYQLSHSYQGAPSIRSFRSFFNIDWPSASQHPFFYVGIFAAIGLLNAFCIISSVAAQYTGALRASRVLFKQLLVTVVRATFRFHDTTPHGRMTNRFGKDISTIDSSLAGSLQSVNSSLATFFASIITVAVVFPYFLVPAFFIGFAYRELAIGYLNTGRDLRRMESNTRSPIFSDFGEILEGIVTVRAFSAERRFLNNVFVKIDTTTKMWYNFWMTNRWLLLNFDALGALSVLVTTLFSISTLTNEAGLAGLCITSAMAFTTSVYWACRSWTALELDLNSVERVIEYLDLPQEPPAVIESHRVPAYWPSNTKNDSLLVAENLIIKYAPDLPTVLHDVSFTLKAGERVGLLGRTGSGKSTLAMSIFRFVDPISGRIIIDGIDISTIGIHDLRSRLTFIPQDATLFSGTLRDNLDPFDEHTDIECLDVLSRVQIITPSTQESQSSASSSPVSRPPSVHTSEREVIVDSSSIATTDVESKMTITLDTKVSAGGVNFSQGQRQLIALARALLRRSSIIILDEATSSIDFETDAKIQTTIRQEFNNSLLLTVAHRIRTVIDYDRLLVLDKGKVVECDTPWNLIQKADGVFRGMCLKSGTFGELEAVAKAKAFSA